MLKEIKQNIIHETAQLIVAGEKDFNECDREMKDMVIWYLRFDKKM